MTGESSLRAPLEDGQALLEPPLAALGRVLAANRAGLPASLAEQAARAKVELLQLAREYTAEYRDVPAESTRIASAPVILAGHQPQLFHAGVWFKSFVLSALGRQHSAQAVNLLIDNDAAGTAAIRVPSGTLGEPRVEAAPYDSPQREIPFEERSILDRACFDSFGNRAAEAIHSLVPTPLVREWWPAAIAAGRRTRNLGRALAEARHKLEEAWGLFTLEAPLGRVCETDSFRRFALGILLDLARFREIHNSSLADYRRVNKIRSRTHPVSELAADGEYLEAPFWLWTSEYPLRRRCFARRAGGRLEVTDRDRLRFELPISSGASDQLADLTQGGVKLRPRALITTAYARLFLSDLFVHGIGGAKYDQLTDAILARFYHVAPPAFAVATATMRLPLGLPGSAPGGVSKHGPTLRDLRYHPERFLDASQTDIWKLVAEKQRWIAQEAAAEARAARHREIERVNLALQPAVEELRERVLKEHREFESRQRAHLLLGSREFAFCLFPAGYLRETLTRLAGLP